MVEDFRCPCTDDWVNQPAIPTHLPFEISISFVMSTSFSRFMFAFFSVLSHSRPTVVLEYVRSQFAVSHLLPDVILLSGERALLPRRYFDVLQLVLMNLVAPGRFTKPYLSR